jgi:hypothetical protein
MKAMRTTVLAMSMILSTAINSFSQSYYNGSTLLERCSSQPGDTDYMMDTAFCIGYVVAIRDASQCGISVNGISSSTPKGAGLPQLVKVVVKWFNDHPEKLHLSAETLVAWALYDAFPCP